MYWNIKNILFISIVLYLSSQQVALGKEYSPNYVFIFSFLKEDANTLPKFELENKAELEIIGLAINPRLELMRVGESHLRIVSYIGKSEVIDTVSLCNAFRRAGLVRSYMFAKYEIPESNCTFYVDTIADKSSMVSVQFVDSLAEESENRALYYTLKEGSSLHKTVMGMFDEIPYLDRENSLSNEHFTPLTRSTDYISVFKYQRSKVTSLDENKFVVSSYCTNSDAALFAQPTESYSHSYVGTESNLGAFKVSSDGTIDIVGGVGILGGSKYNSGPKPEKRLFLGIKTDLVLFAGVVSTNHLSNIIPNLGLDFYFAKRFSVSLDGSYNMTMDQEKESDKWFGYAHVALEPRVWTSRKNTFSWLYIGLYGLYGEFDVSNNDIIGVGNIGNTGSFYAGGLSIGCAIPVSDEFAIELGVRGGYMHTDIEEYLKPQSIIDNSMQKGLSLQNISLSLVYRIGLKI